MLAPVLREAFVMAQRRPGFILLDIFWKLAWLAITLAALSFVAYSFLSNLEFQLTNVRVIDAWLIASQLRQFWSEYGAPLLLTVLAVLAGAAVFYLILEAAFRRRLVVASRAVVFIGSSFAKTTILVAAGMTCLLFASASAYAGLAAFAGFIALAFLLTILDTLIRSDAVDLLGADLLGVTGVIGTLLLFESMIGAALGITLLTGFLNVSGSAEALTMFGVTTLVLLLFNFLHSYLLVVRFSAVGIMRRNVIDV
jgi:hypothetical protein